MMTTLKVRKGYLFVEYTTPYRFEGGLALLEEIRERCRRAGVQKTLCDMRKMKGKISVMDGFKLALAGAQVLHGLQVAAVYRKEDLDPLPEMVMNNRGGDVRIFTDLASAKEWLGVT
jgi:hypothetical protein